MSIYTTVNIGERSFNVDIDANKEYYSNHSLCNCSEDRNFYKSAKTAFPQLDGMLSSLGILIERPDEIGSSPSGNVIDYHFVSYTVIGENDFGDKYEFHVTDNGSHLKIVVDNWYVPNEQKTDKYFTLTVYNIKLPWILNEPFPDEKAFKKIFSKIKTLLKTNK